MRHAVPVLVCAALAMLAFALWDYAVELWHRVVAAQVEAQLAARVDAALQAEREKHAADVARLMRVHDAVVAQLEREYHERTDTAVADVLARYCRERGAA